MGDSAGGSVGPSNSKAQEIVTDIVMKVLIIAMHKETMTGIVIKGQVTTKHK